MASDPRHDGANQMEAGPEQDQPLPAHMAPVAHTPGPWEVVRHRHIDDELWLSVNQHADAAGMKPWIAEIKYLCTAEAEQWANARLIAAAPKMLAALKEVERNCPCGARPESPRTHPHVIGCPVGVAITEAEGR